MGDQFNPNDGVSICGAKGANPWLLYTTKYLQMMIGTGHSYVEGKLIVFSSSSVIGIRLLDIREMINGRKVVVGAKERSAFFQTVAKARSTIDGDIFLSFLLLYCLMEDER